MSGGNMHVHVHSKNMRTLRPTGGPPPRSFGATRRVIIGFLAPVHDWSTEGFDTADLKEVKVLLDALK